MRAAGLVRTTTGADAPTRRIALTAKARRIAGQLAAEWRATEAAVADTRERDPVPGRPGRDRHRGGAARRSFHDRIAEKLAADPDWK